MGVAIEMKKVEVVACWIAGRFEICFKLSQVNINI